MILRALAYAGLMFLWAMIIAVALVTFGCAAPQPGWLDWWNTDQSVPPPPMGEPIDAPTTATVAILTLEDAPIDWIAIGTFEFIDIGPLPDPIPLEWDGDQFEAIEELP